MESWRRGRSSLSFVWLLVLSVLWLSWRIQVFKLQGPRLAPYAVRQRVDVKVADANQITRVDDNYIQSGRRIRQVQFDHYKPCICGTF